MGDQVGILHMLPDLRTGGGQHLLLRNIAGMAGAGFAHHVCAVRDGGEMRGDFERVCAGVHCLGVRGAAGVPGGVRRVVRIIGEVGIDVVHTNNTGEDRLFGQLGAAIRGVPVVNTIHAEYHERPPGRGVRGAIKGLPRAVKRAGQLRLGRLTVRHGIAVSERVRRGWEPMLREQGLGAGRVTVVYPGLDLERYGAGAGDEPRRGALRRAIAPPGAGPILMNVARLVRGKGHEHLPPLMREVLRAHPRAHLVLVGDGELRGAIEGRARECGVEGAVTFLGSRADVPELLGAADLFVFPSLSEGFGLAVLEAMAAGVPVVAFRLPSLEEFVGQGAELVPNGDGGALGATVVEVLGDSERMEMMGRAGRGIVEARFDQRACSEALARIYLSVLATPERETAPARPGLR